MRREDFLKINRNTFYPNNILYCTVLYCNILIYSYSSDMQQFSTYAITKTYIWIIEENLAKHESNKIIEYIDNGSNAIFLEYIYIFIYIFI